jgi:hypothetical protein
MNHKKYLLILVTTQLLFPFWVGLSIDSQTYDPSSMLIMCVRLLLSLSWHVDVINFSHNYMLFIINFGPNHIML